MKFNKLQFTGKLVMAVKSADDKTEDSSASSEGTVIKFTASAAGATAEWLYQNPSQDWLKIETLNGWRCG